MIFMITTKLFLQILLSSLVCVSACYGGDGGQSNPQEVDDKTSPQSATGNQTANTSTQANECRWKAGRACYTESKSKGQVILLEMLTQRSFAFHDPDDVRLVSAADNEDIPGGFWGSVQVDENDKVIEFSAELDCVRRIYRYEVAEGNKIPEFIDISYGVPIGMKIQLKNSCNLFSDDVLDFFKIK